jgi:hypothetical protein
MHETGAIEKAVSPHKHAAVSSSHSVPAGKLPRVTAAMAAC